MITRTAFRAALGWMLLCAAPGDSRACDFCSRGGQNFRALQVEVAANKIVAFGQPTQRDASGADFLIDTVLKGEVKPGDELRREVDLFYLPGMTYLILDDGVIPLQKSSAAFVGKLVTLPKDPVKRLLLFLPYLTDSDDMVAASAREAFAGAPYKQVKALRPHLDPDAILASLQKTKTRFASRGIHALLLGVGGTAEHAKKLEPMLLEEKRQQRPGYDGMLAAYLMLRGPDGIATIHKALAAVADEDRARPAIAYMRALRFHQKDERILTREQVLASLRTLLQYADFADATVFELKRLKDWSSRDRIEALGKQHGEKMPWVRRAVEDYLKVCPKE